MDLILTDFHPTNQAGMFVGNLLHNVFEARISGMNEHLTTILRKPDYMIRTAIGYISVCGNCSWHRKHYTARCCIMQYKCSRLALHPIAKARGSRVVDTSSQTNRGF